MAHNPMQIMQLYQQLRGNPFSVVSQRFSLPQNITNPQDIVQHLLNTNQISQSQVNQAMNMRNNFFR